MECIWPVLVLILCILENAKTINSTTISYHNSQDNTDHTTRPVHMHEGLRLYENSLHEDKDDLHDGFQILDNVDNEQMMVQSDPESVHEADIIYNRKTMQELEQINNKGPIQEDIETEQDPKIIYIAPGKNRRIVMDVLSKILMNQKNRRSINNEPQRPKSIHKRRTLEEHLSVDLMNLDHIKSLQKGVQPMEDATGPWSIQNRQQIISTDHKRRRLEEVNEDYGDAIVHHNMRRSVNTVLQPTLQDRNKSVAPNDHITLDQDLDGEVDEANLHLEKEGIEEDGEDLIAGEMIEDSEEIMQNLKLNSEEETRFGDTRNIEIVKEADYVSSPLSGRRARSQAARRHKLRAQSQQSHLTHARNTRD